jgi:ubiquitin carboxyl-terminal hydrolase 9/24
MEVSEEHVQTLLSMGFYEVEVRYALKMAKNDLNDAVAILTNEHPTTSFDTMQDLDIDSGVPAPLGSGSGTVSPIYGPAPPPSYNEVVSPTGSQSLTSPKSVKVQYLRIPP